jgi:hypothetical protein
MKPDTFTSCTLGCLLWKPSLVSDTSCKIQGLTCYPMAPRGGGGDTIGEISGHNVATSVQRLSLLLSIACRYFYPTLVATSIVPAFVATSKLSPSSFRRYASTSYVSYSLSLSLYPLHYTVTAAVRAKLLAWGRGEAPWNAKCMGGGGPPHVYVLYVRLPLMEAFFGK